MFPMNQSNETRPFGCYCSECERCFWFPLDLKPPNQEKQRFSLSGGVWLQLRQSKSLLSLFVFISLHPFSFPLNFSVWWRIWEVTISNWNNFRILIDCGLLDVGLKRRFSEDEEMDDVATAQAVSSNNDPPQHLYQHTQSDWKRNKTGIAKKSKLNRKLGNSKRCWIHPRY